MSRRWTNPAGSDTRGLFGVAAEPAELALVNQVDDVIFVTSWLTPSQIDQKCSKKICGSGGIRTHASEETGALNQRLRPLGHATYYVLCPLQI